MFYTDRTYKNGANCPTVAHNSSIKLDEFEYDVTSVRPGAHMCIFCAHVLIQVTSPHTSVKSVFCSAPCKQAIG